MVSQYFNIVNLDEKYFNDIVTLSNQQFGDDFLSIDQLSNQTKGYVAVNGTKVLGFLIYKVCNQFSDLESIVLKDKKEVEQQINHHFPVGVISTIAVDINYSNQGIGKKILDTALNDLSNQCKSMISFLWEHPNGTPLAHLLKQYDFNQLKTIKNYWFDDALLKGYNCKYCGNPCKCNCLVYFREKNG